MINAKVWWVLGAAALIVIGLAVNMSATTVHATVCPPDPLSPPGGMSPPGGVSGPGKVCDEPTAEPTEVPTAVPTAVPGAQKYTGDLAVIDDLCGGGTISLTVNADGSAITMLVLDGAVIGGVAVNTLSVPEGPFVVMLDPGVPIAADGSISADFEPLTGVVAHIEAMLDGDTLSGTVGIEALACETTFSAEVSDVAPPPVVAPTTGSGPGGGSSNEALLLTLLVAGVGAVALGATGLVAVRRRDA